MTLQAVSALARQLRQDPLCGGMVLRPDEAMASHTTLRVGGPADLWIEPADAAQVRAVVRAAQGHGVPLTVVGKGSNILVRDGGIRGAVLHIGGAMAAHQVSGTQLVAQAGLPLPAASRAALAASLDGLSFAEGIPGSVGGAACMNAGAYGSEMCRVVSSVDIVDEHGEARTLPADRLGYGYRHSTLLEHPWIVTGVTFSLTPGDPSEIRETMRTLGERRRAKQPVTLPSCGSTFKRPQGAYAAQLIEESGLKGARIGGAEVSTLHAGFVVTVDHATARDVLALIAHIQRQVMSASGIQLEPEVRIIGEDA